MAEVQKTTVSGEMTFRFIEFVRMHAQNASLFLGRIPNPQTGKPQVNLDVARMLIGQLAAIEVKTRGNLTAEETSVLENTLASLEAGYAEAAHPSGGGGTPPRPAAGGTVWTSAPGA